MTQNFGKVAVLMGGFSSEREISLTSGHAILDALCSKGVDAYAFDPAETALSELKKQGFQAAFNILHGNYGEDGTVQGALEALGIPYTGCGVLASALGMDKYRCKLIWSALGLPVPPFVVLHDDTDFSAVEQELGLPLFVKPSGAKYNRNDTIYLCPSDLSETDETQIRSLAEQAFAAIGGEKTCGRVDFLKDKNGKLFLLEVNTLPGMTSHSLIPKSAKQMGIEFADLCVAILKNAVKM